jgi:hypothetical protein
MGLANFLVRQQVAEQDERRPSETVPFQTVPFQTVQIIAGALIVGPLLFAGIAFVAAQGQQPRNDILAYIAIGFAMIALVASPVVSTIAANQRLRQLESRGPELSLMDLFGVLGTRVIVRAAILEGAVFFCCIAYMVTALWWTLGTALLLLALMIPFFPTRGRFDDWVREQREIRSLDGERRSS